MSQGDFLLIFSLVIGLISIIPYIISMVRRITYPHPFSWLTWSLTTFIVFLAQISEKGGLGSYVAFFSSLQCLFIGVFALKISHKLTIRPTDWYMLGASLLALILWLFTDVPLYSVILITAVDVFGHFPTFRKGYFLPFEDMPFVFILTALKFLPSLFLFEEVNFTNSFYPIVLILMEGSLGFMLIIRRWQLKRTSPDSELQNRSFLI